METEQLFDMEPVEVPKREFDVLTDQERRDFLKAIRHIREVERDMWNSTCCCTCQPDISFSRDQDNVIKKLEDGLAEELQM